MEPDRTTQAAYVVAKLRVRRLTSSKPAILLNWSEKWGDWSLPGGHLEAGETFYEAAMREASEELATWRASDHYAVSTKEIFREEWRAPSKSARGRQTNYVCAWHRIYFFCPPEELPDLGPYFRWMVWDDLAPRELGSPVLRLSVHFSALELSWPTPVDFDAVNSGGKGEAHGERRQQE